MRRTFAPGPFVLVLGVLGPFAFAAPGCSSNDTTSPAVDSGVIGANQLQGQPCDPTLASPCLAVPGCFTAFCAEAADGTSSCSETPIAGCEIGGDGGEIVIEAGPGVDSAVKTCESNLDCPSIPAGDASLPVVYVCGFSAFDGCGAVGECVLPSPPHILDGALQTACGCEGQSVPYVTDELTGEPVASAAPCTPTGVDSGTGIDAAVDAGADATSLDAAADASEDAPADATGGG